MSLRFAVYDTVYLKFDGPVLDDVNQAAEDAATLTASTGRLHEVRLIPGDTPGVAETAFLVGTATSTTGGVGVDVALEADDRYGDLPEWVTIVAGEAVLDESAGGCVASILGQAQLDFSETTLPSGDTSGADWNLNRDDALVVNAGTSVPEVEDDVVELPVSDAKGDFIFGGTLSVQAEAYAGSGGGAVADGVATHRVAVNVTRVAPSPTLSE